MHPSTFTSAVLTAAVFLAHVQASKKTKHSKANPKPIPPQYAPQYIPPECLNFTFGQWKMREFYSPNYPRNYSENADCVKSLIAPKGHIIELDFREKFRIEEGTKEFLIEEGTVCKYDFVEVRDGPFGYSPLLGRFCGSKFPPLIESTQRFMWLRFRSDALLNYEGFIGVYRYKSHSDYTFKKSIQKKRDVCEVRFRSNDGDRKLSSKVDLPYGHLEESKQEDIHVDCTWHISTLPHHRIMFRPTMFDVIDVVNCKDNFVQIYDGTTLRKDLVTTFCVGEQESVTSKTNRLFVRLFGHSIYHTPTLDAVFTPFWTRDKCEADAHSCGNNICISATTRCNQIQNCDDLSDEAGCPSNGIDDSASRDVTPVDDTTTSSIPLYTIILGAVGGFLFVTICIIICVTCRYKKCKKKTFKEQQHGDEESRRQSYIDARKSPSLRISNGCSMSTPGSRSPIPTPCMPVTSLAKADIHPGRPDSGFTDTIRSVDVDFTDQLSDAGKFKRFKSMDYYPESQIGCIKPISKPYVYYSDADLKYESFYPQRSLERPAIKIAYPLSDVHPISTVHEHSHFLTIPSPQRYMDKINYELSSSVDSPPSYSETAYTYPL